MITLFVGNELPQIIQLWQQTLPKSVPEDYFIKQVFFDENFDPSLIFIAWEDEKVVGFLLAHKRKLPHASRGLEENIGFITLLCVDEKYQKRGIGRALLKEAEQKLQQKGATKIKAGGYSPHYVLPGACAETFARDFFIQVGYKDLGAAFSMSRKLAGYEMPPKIAAKKAAAEQNGFTFRAFETADSVNLLNMIEKEFSAGWYNHVKSLIADKIAAENIVICLDKNGKAAGYCQRAMDRNPQRFGPFGVAETQRNHSLGGILIALMLESMRDKKIENVFFMSTDIPGRRFYERHGFTVNIHYHPCEKNV